MRGMMILWWRMRRLIRRTFSGNTEVCLRNGRFAVFLTTFYIAFGEIDFQQIRRRIMDLISTTINRVNVIVGRDIKHLIYQSIYRICVL